MKDTKTLFRGFTSPEGECGTGITCDGIAMALKDNTQQLGVDDWCAKMALRTVLAILLALAMQQQQNEKEPKMKLLKQ